MEAQDSQGLKLPLKSDQIVTLMTLVPKRFDFYSYAFFILTIPSLFTACLACKLYFHDSIWEFYPVISAHNYQQVSVSDDNLGLAVERQLLKLPVCSSSGQALLGQILRALRGSCTVKAVVLFCSLQLAVLCDLCFK